jgi:hypothetical protein
MSNGGNGDNGFGSAATDHNGPADDRPQIVVVGPEGVTLSGSDGIESDDDRDRGGDPVTDLVNQPAKVMRIGNMIRQLLEEVRTAPLDEAGRARLTAIHAASLKELESGLAPELVDELERITLPFSDAEVPSESELRIAQAQLVGWLEGLFHGIQTALVAQQMAAHAQLENMRRALPAGPSAADGQRPAPGMYL